jgi:capsular polysaccharide transport system permease protein
MNDLSPPSVTDSFAVLEPVADGRLRPSRTTRRPQPLHRPVRRIVLFLLLVALPVAVTAAYEFGLAADRFESGSVYVVRNPGDGGASAIGTNGQAASNVFARAGLPLVSNDSFAVQEFILSRDAMRLANQQLDLRRMLAGPVGDVLWHFPWLAGSDTDEALYRTYLRHVGVHYDFNTNISTLTVQAFSADDAQRIATALLNLSEDLVNRLNERGQQDAIRAADEDVAKARDAARQAIDRMMDFRVRENVVDPNGSANVLSKVLVTLLGQLIDTRAQIDILRNTAPRSPQISPLQAKAASIQQEIDSQKAGISHGNAALAPQIAEYERLALDEEFTNRALLAALAAQEQAREVAERKHVYLDRIAAPASPDEARYPWRILNTLIVSVAALLLFALFMPLMGHRPRRSAQ